jgi:hypothetical protein
MYLTLLYSDQCPAMKPAIEFVFYNTLHKLCRWHMLKKFHQHLANLYKIYPTFKDEFTAILNWPLMPTEFEDAWHQLVDKYNLHDDTMMMQLWEDREEWISAYFKNIFCARMTSTQCSESMNAALKRGFVSERKNLHRFADEVNKFIFSRRENEHSQTMASLVRALTVTFLPFLLVFIACWFVMLK